MSGTEYLPHKGDIVSINFNPSAGIEIQKRRPALVISNAKYARLTGLTVVCPITHASNNRLKDTGILVELHQDQATGFVNPLQFHTFDFRRREFKFIEHAKAASLNAVMQVVNDVINAQEDAE